MHFGSMKVFIGDFGKSSQDEVAFERNPITLAVFSIIFSYRALDRDTPMEAAIL